MAEAVWGEFERAEDMARALHALRERGHTSIEAFSPFAVPETFSAYEHPIALGPLRLGVMPLPWVALVAGALGGILGYLVQWFANARVYPQNAGGRPANAIPAFVFTTFESIVLAGAGAVFLALLLILRFPRLWDPREAVEGLLQTTDDRFGILVTDPEPWLVPDEIERILREHGARTVRRVEAA